MNERPFLIEDVRFLSYCMKEYKSQQPHWTVQIDLFFINMFSEWEYEQHIQLIIVVQQ